MKNKEIIILAGCSVVIVLLLIFTAIRAKDHRNLTGTITEEVATASSEDETTSTPPLTTTKPTTTTTTTNTTTTETETTTEKKTTTTTKKVVTTAEIVSTGNDGDKTNLGSFYITYYTPYEDSWRYSTATGVRSTHLKTCAVDPSVIPLGSTIYVNGLELKAVDTGSAVKGKHIDIFFDGTKSEARAWIDEFGERADVYI